MWRRLKSWNIRPPIPIAVCSGSLIALAVIEELGRLVTIVDKSLYQDCEASARERVGRRDPNDWPVVAVSFALGLEVWTEDQDSSESGFRCGPRRDIFTAGR
jgi:PIN domain